MLSFFHTNGQGNLTIDHITPDDGLSYRWVFDIIQDQNDFMWMGTYDGLNRYDGSQVRLYRNIPNDTTSLSNNRLRMVAEDNWGQIWAVGEDLVFNILDSNQQSFQHIPSSYFSGDNSNILVRVLDMFPLNEQTFCLVTFVFDEENDNRTIHFDTYQLGDTRLQSKAVFDTKFIFIDGFIRGPDHKFWLCDWQNGYMLIDLKSNSTKYFDVKQKDARNERFPIDINGKVWLPNFLDGPDVLPYKFPAEESAPEIVIINTDNNGDFWIMMQNGTWYRIDAQKKIFEEYKHNALRLINDRTGNFRTSYIYQDREKNYWSGHFYGALKFRKSEQLFNQFFSQKNNNPAVPIVGVSARNMVEMPDGTIWMRDQVDQLYKIEPNTGVHRKVTILPEDNTGILLPKDFVKGITNFAEHFIIIATSVGLLKLDVRTEKYALIKYPNRVKKEINAIFTDANKTIWVYSDEGAFKFDPANNSYDFPDQTFGELKNRSGYEHATYDESENVIYTQYDHGIQIIDCSTSELKLLALKEEKLNYQIYSFLKWEDNYWLATPKGLARYNTTTDDYRMYTISDGLPDNIIYSVLRSEQHLWLGTHYGLCQIDPKDMRMNTYFVSQGLPHNEFNRWSYYRSSEGQLYFGGLNGLIGFDPKNFQLSNEKYGQLHFVKKEVYDKTSDEFEVEEYSSFEKNIELELKPNERTFTFHFALNLFEASDKIQYEYFLDGLDPGWINNGNQTSVRFYQVPPGKYNFRVRAKGPRKVLAKNELNIPVLVNKVWYYRWWAYTLYGVLAFAVTMGLYRIQLKRRIDKQESDRIRELDQVKTKMYTNITHEFRTPLTVMLGMNEAANKYTKIGAIEKAENAHRMIDRNGQNLLGLINQMLDLSKLESGQLDLHLQQSDIKKYIKYLLDAIHPFAKEKNIGIHFHSSEQEIIMDFDKDKMAHIFNNLLSNALKFTPDGGHVYIQLSVDLNDNFILAIRDTGVGIDSEKIAHIFDRFYQADDSHTRKGEGTGIGLSLVNELVKLKNGTIEVDSKVNEGTEFLVQLPMTNKAPLINISGSKSEQSVAPIFAESRAASENDELNTQDNRPLLLIVEDNPDVLHYIRICVEDEYQTIMAVNGNEGIEKSIEHIPDLIISDVMMPEKDGFELCEAVKTDERTSHIPVILLTAKSDVASTIEGLEHGADAYMSKPFNQKELTVRLKNLFELRRVLQSRYSNTNLSNVDQTLQELDNVEDVFLRKVRDLLLENLDDEDFGIVQLCRKLRISRVQLHRKLKALTGVSASHYIRSIRLNRAKELLIEGKLNVSEVAYEVGFKNQSHFSRVFAEEFGKSPSEWGK